MTVGPLMLDGEGDQVTHHGESVHPSLREFQILALLMARPEHTFTYEEICQRVWATNAARRSNTLSVNVKRLRDKLGDGLGNPRLIQTVRGVGYRLVTPGGQP
jgi:two-component system, OmpR family, response regulator